MTFPPGSPIPFNISTWSKIHQCPDLSGNCVQYLASVHNWGFEPAKVLFSKYSAETLPLNYTGVSLKTSKIQFINSGLLGRKGHVIIFEFWIFALNRRYSKFKKWFGKQYVSARNVMGCIWETILSQVRTRNCASEPNIVRNVHKSGHW